MDFLEIFNRGGAVLSLVFAALLIMSCLSWYIIVIKSIRIKREYYHCNRFFNQHATSKDWAARADLVDFLSKILKQETAFKTTLKNSRAIKNESKDSYSKTHFASKKMTSALHFLLAEVFDILNLIVKNNLVGEAKEMSYKNQELPCEKQKEVITIHLLQALDEIRLSLDRGLTILATIGSTAPFVGLFGTVWGIYGALGDIAVKGNATINIVAGPIGEALIATAVGLFAAIPAVLAYNSFVRLNRVLVQNLRHLAEQIEAWQS